MNKKSRAFWVLAIFLSLLLIACFLLYGISDRLREIREQRYLELAALSAKTFDVPLPMVLAVIRTESDFRPNAVSSAGAMGLMQLMPDTFSYLRDEKFEESLSDSAILEPAHNIRYGTYYLSYLYERFGDWKVALAAYNARESRVADWLDDPTLSPDGVLLTIPFPETASYVESVLDAFEYYSQKYNE